MLEDKDLVSIQEVRTKVEKAYAAWQKYRAYNQAQVDAIVERMAAAGRANAERLAAMAVDETGYGNVKDKIAKNLLNADLLPRKMRGMRTVGMLREVPEERIVEYAVPVGVVAAMVILPGSLLRVEVAFCIGVGVACAVMGLALVRRLGAHATVRGQIPLSG